SNELDVFSGMSYNMQTFEAKSLAEKMAHLYESVIVLEWAERYQGKFVKLADIYIEDTWHIRELGDQMTTVNYFKDIIYVSHDFLKKLHNGQISNLAQKD